MARVSTQLALQVAKLNLVDLAGVERLKKTKGDTGSLMRKEACINNKTLSFLEQVRMLFDGIRFFIMYPRINSHKKKLPGT